ncbi:hypothetical protein [Altericroceibacterium endophyticum]|uniref:Uncharacterized protein n=1 Tax=Altericroceibacterium endophyticum TaxID=1808508 RepID=A0A6I4T4Y6_9SPHN|nr:hypothetical protein [Altericroceibacterium endophyticum]MXO65966.1 hypothetical protein [Altericroceibacterium endophyticum]
MRLAAHAADGMLQSLGRTQDSHFPVADLHTSHDAASIILPQCRIALAQALPHEPDKLLNNLGSDAPFGVCELAFQKDDVGFHLHKLVLLLSILPGEARVGSCKMAFGDEIKQTLKSGLECSLPGAQLP